MKSKQQVLDVVRSAFGPGSRNVLGPCICDRSKFPKLRLPGGRVVQTAPMREEFTDLTPGEDNRTYVTCMECQRTWTKDEACEEIP